mgnify:CR=1 FL=1
MNTIHYDSSEKTPMIRGDIEKGEITIKGRSYPESTTDFYKDFKVWLQSFYANAPNTVTVVLDLEYFNTSTTAVLYDMIQQLSKLKDDKKISVTWYFDEDDYDMIDKGHELQRLLGDMIHLKIRNSET